MSKEFKLRKLDPSKNEIRLLLILPRCFKPGREGEIFCEVWRRTLIEVNNKYNALSYTWGQALSAKSIIVLAKGVEMKFEVQESLYQALWHIRLENDPVLLWADAICINQKDPDEKTDQLRQMRRVYEMAALVVVWLGPAADDSDAVVSGMKQVAADLDTKRHRRLFLSGEGLLGGLFTIQGMSSFLARPWWSRVWVIQEIKVAKRVIFLCGGQYIDKGALSAFLGSFYELRRRSFTRPNLADDQGRVQLAGKDPRPRLLLSHLIWNTEQHERRRTLLQWLSEVCARHPENSTQRMGTKDPRDFIFALLGLCKKSESEAGSAWNYKTSCHDVYLEAARIMLKGNRMAVLSYAQTPKQIWDLPS